MAVWLSFGGVAPEERETQRSVPARSLVLLKKRKITFRDFAGGPVVKTPQPLQGKRVPSLVGEIRSRVPASKVALMIKDLPVNAGDISDTGSIPRSGRSLGEGNANPLQYSFLENPHGQSLVGYSPWGHKESDTTERLSTWYTCLKYCMRHTYTHKLSLIQLILKGNWVSCILSGNPSLEVKQRDVKQ